MRYESLGKRQFGMMCGCVGDGVEMMLSFLFVGISQITLMEPTAEEYHGFLLSPQCGDHSGSTSLTELVSSLTRVF